MNVRGTVHEVGEVRSVSTRYGQSDVAEVSIIAEEYEPRTVTLWGKWTETVDYLDAGMDLLVTDVETDEYGGEIGFSTSKESFVVVDPAFLVNVTDVRSWVQCPRMYYLNKLSGIPLNYPVVKGTIVHEVFGDLLRGRDLDESIEDRVADAGLDLGLLGKPVAEVEGDVRNNARAIEGWLQQGTLSDSDSWRSEYTLISETFGIKGRCDAIRRGMPVELKTGKNTKRDPRFQDKVQAACYALMLREHEERDARSVSEDGTSSGSRSGEDASRTSDGSSGERSDPRDGTADTGTLLYTKNTALDRSEATGDLSPAKEFAINDGFLKFVVRKRNEIAAMEHGNDVPTGYEAGAKCQYCFEKDTCMVVSGRLDQESKAGKIGSPIPGEEREYFDRFYRLVEEERREVHREYAKLWEQSAEERADDDRALIDLEPVGQKRIEGGRWELRARRTTGAVSKIRDGDVVLASDGDPVKGHAELGRVKHLSDEIVVTTDEPVELRRLDVYPSDYTTGQMLTALHDHLLKGDERRKDVLFGREKPEFSDGNETFIDNNEAQNDAVNLAMNAEDFALVHGPPGTGKTYTIARIIREFVERGDRVLLSAFTNRAVDNALEALRDQGFDDFVRVGTETGIREDMLPYRLETRGDPTERAAEIREASVVAATTATCGSRIMREQAFDATLVDEASQLTEPGTLAPLNLAERFVLVGDHHQLPPVVRAENDLSTSLFERLITEHPDAGVMLDRQYRMAQRIQAFSSREFYDGELRPANGETAGQRLAHLPDVDADALPPELRDAVSLVDPEGAMVGNTNPTEADRVRDVVSQFLDAGVSAGDIGVIAPFRAQVAEITRRVPADVTVDTVDRFQGSSKEVVVVSFVATGTLEGPIFDDYRRVNVALTRAKKSLVLVGDESALRSADLYRRMADWAA